MAEELQGQNPDIIAYAGDIVAAYVSNNPVPAAELPALIAKVHAALAGLAGAGSVAAEPEIEVERPTPAQIRKSITDEGIVSFIDGKPYKTLKRHLTKHGLTPQAYRQRYGLPADYPMVAPGYAAQRSALAKEIGLGRPGAQAERSGGRRDAA
ncbi:MucR family transcriptional regulator [Methylobacterium dankookense]|uniref:Transcriptional regulatory protein ros n=1 Tax=Methylobacterium dankookense TaxID=560405 RepID=A0A564G4S0_9HYPH|nr:MucR family transcriptional regulator [Methylobacterium dankookense]GJD56511.1 Transcriptional regulatory protein ros [Methylobacterium dankookense]VUF15307.1 Transcriptional regulatory protein ros [Methylobacterium dankookense]